MNLMLTLNKKYDRSFAILESKIEQEEEMYWYYLYLKTPHHYMRL